MTSAIRPMDSVTAASFSGLSRVDVNGFWDGLQKLFRGELRFPQFCSYVSTFGKEATFKLAFASRSDLESKLQPLLARANSTLTPREGKTIFDLLNVADHEGVTVAMAACSNPNTRASALELFDKLNIQQQQELLQKKTTAIPAVNLYAYIAAQGNFDTSASEDIRNLYQRASVNVDDNDVISAISQQDISQGPAPGYNIGGKTDDVQAQDDMTELAKMCHGIGFKSGEKITEQQVASFAQWLIPTGEQISAGSGSNADIFVAALSGNDTQKHIAKTILDALFAYDGGKTLKEKIFLLEDLFTDADYGRDSPIGLANYAREHCLPDASIASLKEYYDKCGLGDEFMQVRQSPNVGAPLVSGPLGTAPSDMGAVVSAKVKDNTRSSGVGRLIYTPNVKGKGPLHINDIRQLAQFSNLKEVTVDSCTLTITVESLKHLFLEAEKLETFTIAKRGADNVTRRMAEEALRLANEELSVRGEGRSLNISINGGE
ncbi:MAG: hypothetical protein LBI34_03075 [Puniceicoccales bacterium]|jgi:hypothetical protein|nr:hypothetical protein [Puniceicoccales bacterium]